MIYTNKSLIFAMCLSLSALVISCKPRKNRSELAGKSSAKKYDGPKEFKRFDEMRKNQFEKGIEEHIILYNRAGHTLTPQKYAGLIKQVVETDVPKIIKVICESAQKVNFKIVTHENIIPTSQEINRDITLAKRHPQYVEGKSRGIWKEPSHLYLQKYYNKFDPSQKLEFAEAEFIRYAIDNVFFLFNVKTMKSQSFRVKGFVDPSRFLFCADKYKFNVYPQARGQNGSLSTDLLVKKYLDKDS